MLDAGDHKIEVYYYGRPVNGSPFMCRVVDWSQITVTNLYSIGRIGKPVEFDSMYMALYVS